MQENWTLSGASILALDIAHKIQRQKSSTIFVHNGAYTRPRIFKCRCSTLLLILKCRCSTPLDCPPPWSTFVCRTSHHRYVGLLGWCLKKRRRPFYFLILTDGPPRFAFGYYYLHESFNRLTFFSNNFWSPCSFNSMINVFMGGKAQLTMT